ncbi:MAG: hypothetical protein A2096_03585 [Spirochaetes bacterium GWF1_41_5]|nr:MAG: hypothetical protein A2096_03585 [Spirochaetes bacterium GWF1_41_5]HBE03383.1 hypothetical protein [Spirochaetia bacterium]
MKKYIFRCIPYLAYAVLLTTIPVQAEEESDREREEQERQETLEAEQIQRDADFNAKEEEKRINEEIDKQKSEAELYDIFLFGMDLYKEKNYRLAVTEFKRFLFLTEWQIQFAEKSSEAVFWTAMSHIQLREYDKAIKEFEKIVSKYPNTPLAPNALFQIGKLYYAAYTKNNLDYNYKANNTLKVTSRDEVISKLMYLESMYSKNQLVDDAWFLIASLYEHDQENKLALQYYQKIINEFPESSKIAVIRKKISELQLK